jgi:hypothetical protein
MPSFATTISLISSILAQETVKLILGLKQYAENAKWTENSGQPLRSVLFMDLKNNRFTPMDLKRGEKCCVCGKEGTAKDIVPRKELSISNLKKNPVKAIRDITNAGDGYLKILVENSAGERSLEIASKIGKELRVGDYLKILAESKSEELQESILKLT